MNRLALCIGNNNYNSLSKLSCAINDAEEVAKALSSMGFDTMCECDLNRTKMIDVIGEFIDKLADYDSCVIYYSGHGCQIEGENILAPIDLDINTRDTSIKLNAFPLEDLMRSLDKYPDKTKVFIFDACRNVLNVRGTLKGFAPVLAPQGSIIAFATSPGQFSIEDSSIGHGVYTNVLLQYICLPRVNIETVFKKTREQMVSIWGTKQIPWEHTSLVGDYYLNPNTIYDGVNYSPDALADSRFSTRDNVIQGVVEGLKSMNWYTQGASIGTLTSLNFESSLASDIFVIGRNIYQAACGNCFDAQSFIDNFESKSINEMAKLHLLNGIAYEIYFNSSNNLRVHPKTGYYNAVIQLLEKDEFFGSRAFISSELTKSEGQIIYIPGQNEIMEFVVEKSDDDKLKSIIYKGINVLCGGNGGIYDIDECFGFEITREQLRKQVAAEIAAPIDCVTFIGEEFEKIFTPYEITIRNKMKHVDNNS